MASSASSLSSIRGARYITDFDGRYIFCTTFHVDSKNTNFFKIGHTQSTPKLCPACLLSFDEQPGWAELGRRLGMSNLKKIYIFGILMKSCTKYVSASSIGQNFFKSWHPYSSIPFHGKVFFFETHNVAAEFY